ncbi:uncharacterized protein LOC111023105 [Momordica charantia]|uniref:Uncharacterized protein LOC111023105 n=1 Tax=Momordica charantia TaxID=3673 RepID=A0A6J1DSH6_MOMCH|nr:uncharacterized protein LOC111023105 [Momordica charantia]
MKRQDTMFSIRVGNIGLLLHATSQLTEIADEVTVKLTPELFSMIASHRSSRFDVVLKLPRNFFTAYSVLLTHTSRISIHAFHTALLDASTSPSMTIHIHDSINRFILRFENSSHQQEKRHELIFSLLPDQDQDEDHFGKLDYGRFFGIHYQDFTQIIARFSIHDDETLLVTSTDSEVTFSTPARLLTLHKEGGKCTILGRGEDEMTQFLITIQPMMFFLGVAGQSQKVWFFKTVDSRGAMRVPFDTYVYVIYFNLI